MNISSADTYAEHRIWKVGVLHMDDLGLYIIIANVESNLNKLILD